MRIAGAGLEKPCCRGLLLLLLLLLFLPRSILSMSLSRPSNNLRIRSTQLELTKHLTGSPTSSFLLAADFRPSSALPELETQTPQLSVSRQPAETRWRSLEVGTLPLFPILCSRECKWQSPSDSANDTLHDPRSMLCRKFCYCRYTTEVLVFFPPVILAAASDEHKRPVISNFPSLLRFQAASSLRRSSRLALSGALSCKSNPKSFGHKLTTFLRSS